MLMTDFSMIITTSVGGVLTGFFLYSVMYLLGVVITYIRDFFR